MAEPSLALQKAIVARLKTPGVLTPAAAVFDYVPEKTAKPYIRVGEDQVLPEAADGFERSVTVNTNIHVFTDQTTGVGRVALKQLCGCVVDQLANAALECGPDFILCELLHEGSRYLEEPDGLTTHGVLSFRATLNPA